MRRWIAWGSLCLLIGVMITGESSTAAQATPCPDVPVIAEHYTYNPDEPILLIGTGNASTTIDVQQLEDDYIGFSVYYGGHDRFEALLVAPDGESDSLFAAIRPAGLTSARPLDQAGEYVIEVEANGPWSIFVH